MTVVDEQQFIDGLRTLGPLIILRERSQSSEPAVVESLPAQGTQEAREGVVLYNPAADPTISMIHARTDLFYVDKDRSSVIELRQSEPLGKELSSGRIWAEMATAEGKKSEAFRRWFEAVARWLRKHYRRDADGTYVGPDADALASGQRHNKRPI